jgi:hypothetical protein
MAGDTQPADRFVEIRDAETVDKFKSMIMPGRPEFGRVLGISPLAAALLISRGFDTEVLARNYLSPKITDLHEPLLLKGMRGHLIAFNELYAIVKGSDLGRLRC